MANGIPARRRTALVASVAAAAVLTATTTASAHQGNTSTDVLHLCVKTSDGTLRAVAPTGPNCRRGERAVHVPLQTAADAEVSWNDLQDVPAWLADDTVSLGDLDDLPAWLADGDVNWGDLQDLPAWLADGDVDWGDLQDVPAFLSDGAVSYDEIAGTQVTDSVTGDTVDDESLTGDDIDDGSLTGADLANGSVTPAQLDPEAASTSDGSLTTISAATTAAPTIPVAITADEPSQVAVSGQVQLTLSACAPCGAEMSYQLLRNDGTPEAPVFVPVSPVYQVELSDTHGLEVASISIIDTVAAGRHGYQLFFAKISGTGTVTTSAGVLNAQVLGVMG